MSFANKNFEDVGKRSNAIRNRAMSNGIGVNGSVTENPTKSLLNASCRLTVFLHNTPSSPN